VRPEPAAVAVARADQQVGAGRGADHFAFDPAAALGPGGGLAEPLGGGVQQVVGGARGQRRQPVARVEAVRVAAEQAGERPVSDEPAPDAGERAEAASADGASGAADRAEAGAGRPAGSAVLEVGVLGRVRLTAAPDGREVTGLRAKVRDLLALLAAHPDGISGEQVGEALWPDAHPAGSPGGCP
jgi:hypothetical protein